MKRLTFLLLPAILLGLLPSAATAQQPSEFYLFVGTYTQESSEGIYLYKFDADEGVISYVSETAGVENPSYLAFSPDHRYLYAVNEMSDPEAASVSSFAFDKTDGTLTFLNKQSSLGGAPCYVSADKSGKAVFVGNYLGGSLAMLPVNGDGSLAEAEFAIRHRGNGVDENRQKSPHVHCTYVAPDNSRIFVADLGTDTVTGYEFDEGEVFLESRPSFRYRTEPGAGPRHLTFHPNGRYAYLINELNGSVVAFRYNNDRLDEIQTVPTIPAGYGGAISGADIHVSPDGRYLYASNREDLNNIVIYAIDRDSGKLSFAGQHPSGGVHPRNFMIDPTGRYLLVANRSTDNIVVFERNRDTGMLTATGTEVEVSMPVCLKMIPAGPGQ